MAAPNLALDFDALRFKPLAERTSKVRLADMLGGLPVLLGAQSLKQLRDAIVAAHSQGRYVLAALGGHVINTGCGPYRQRSDLDTCQ